jgi:hypothetical protein
LIPVQNHCHIFPAENDPPLQFPKNLREIYQMDEETLDAFFHFYNIPHADRSLGFKEYKRERLIHFFRGYD